MKCKMALPSLLVMAREGWGRVGACGKNGGMVWWFSVELVKKN